MNHSRLRSQRVRTFVFPHAPMMDAVEDGRFFEAEGGEQCAVLDGRWAALLEAMGTLGPLAIIVHNRYLRLAALTKRLDFQPEPESGGFVELSSGLMVTPGDWAYALAVQERMAGGSTFGFQFFDHEGRGQLKLLLTREASPERFLSIVDAHAIGGFPPEPRDAGCPVAEQPRPMPALPARSLLQQLWRVTRHETGGRFFPGLPGVTRLDVLRHIGQAYARPIGYEALGSILLEARNTALPLRMTLFSQGAAHAICCLPRSLERCEHGFHLFDAESEFHLFPGGATLFWVIAKGEGHAIEIVSTAGERLGLIESMAIPLWQRQWERLVQAY